MSMMNEMTHRRPNMILILMDDMGWMDLGCYGSSFYETPNLDRLAAEGMTFRDAYAACPVCSPTRASIMSGKYPATLGITNYIGALQEKGKLLGAPYVDHLPLSEKSVAAALRDGGYRTWHVGKWHLGASPYYPQHHGFDVNIGGNHFGQPKSGYFSPYHLEHLEDGPQGEYLTDRLTDEAIALLSEQSDRPFFLHLAHYAVHTPIQAPSEELVLKYERKAEAMGLKQKQIFAEGELFPAEHKKDQRLMRRLVQSDGRYAAMIENLDHNIGRLLDALDQSGQADNTLILFTSDNGGLSSAEGSPTCNAPLQEGKGWMYEGGVREPLIVKWPGVTQPGRICEAPVTSPDFYPTLLEAAGLPLLPEQHRDGVSILPLLQGAEALERESIFWHYPHYGNQGGTPGSSIRMGDYKLIEFFEDGRLELYHLRDDISEEHNLAQREPQLAAKLHAALTKWREETEAILPLPNEAYMPWK
ncbi:sulfatase [Paenibacillus sp. HB172176]|uniref:sulfatase n=1 Tax=Paenibacillus sp. HB172176 TaxID=2493690 RepID=UPI00197F7F1E|nr:sulfatase [Paenibacillus sp. HB172176]